MITWVRKHKYFLLLYVLFILVTQIPFKFPSYDQGEIIPVIIHKLDNNFFSKDWFVQTSLEDNYRHYYVSSVTFLAQFIPLKLLFFLLTLLITFGSYAAIYATARQAFSGKTALMATFFVMFFPSQFSLYTQPIVDHILLPRSVNMLFLLWGFFFYLRGRVTSCLIAIIAALPFHLLQTVFFLFCLLISDVFALRRIWFSLFSVAIVSTATLIFYWSQLVHAVGVSAQGQSEIFHALATIRNPELLSIWQANITAVLFQLVLVLFFLFACREKQYPDKQKKLLWLLPGPILLLIFQYVLTDIFHSYYASFYYGRALIFFNLVLVLFVAEWTSTRAAPILISSVFVPALWAASMAYCALAKRITLFRRAAFSALCIIASLFATQLYFCVIGQCASWHSVLKSWSPVCLVLSTYFFLKNHQRIIPLLLIFSYIALKVLLWPTPAIYLVVDALQHTPSEDVILAPPELGNEIWFLTKHATVLNYDVIPSNSEGALEWRRRLLDLTNNADFSHGSREAIVRQGYDSLEISQIRDLAAKYNASLLLSRKVYDCPLVKQGGSLFIYDLKLCPSA